MPFDSDCVTILCCPEDRHCSQPGCMEGNSLCADCGLPLCRECELVLAKTDPKMPPWYLGNDMMIYYAPTELYALNVTVLEMICASPCITAMVCFTLEMKYRTQQGNAGSVHPYDWSVHMARHRIGSRGNVTSFPLPWEVLLQMLQKGEDTSERLDLPWAGAELANKASILQKPMTTTAQGQQHNLSTKRMHTAMLWWNSLKVCRFSST